MKSLGYASRSALFLALALFPAGVAFAAGKPHTVAPGIVVVPEPAPVLDDAIFVFGGGYQISTFFDSLDPFTPSTYNGEVMLGAGYQHFWQTDPDGFSFGTEIGLAGRLSGTNPSAEIWGGAVGRYDGFTLFDALRVSPALTLGLSYVTGKLTTEADRELESGDQADLLFYLAPELNFSLADHSEWEVFTRLQHRSGAWGTLANIDAANAITIGLRSRF